MSDKKVPEVSPQKERIESFLSAYGKLVQEHQIDFATYPMFVPDGSGGFKVIVQSTPIDITDQPKPSNFMKS